MSAILISGVVVFITHALEAITGFGCAVLAMPFVSSVLGIKMAVQVITILAWLLALYLAIKYWRAINWRQYWTITALMVAGLPFGMYLFRSQETGILSVILALFIIVASVTQLFRLAQDRKEAALPGGWRTLPYSLLLLVGGVVHGLFSTGGPMVVLYATRALQDKGQFRSTLCLLWVTLNTLIITGYIAEGSLTAPVLKTTGLLIPFVVVGVFFGEKIHDKIDRRKFSLVIFSMLLLTGVFMLIKR
ncbi:MAG TPA: sulfite exporter TauE/SafE family protein [Sphaerochaeta sp.]|nr:sulfite exporter TauE/SafE family protein [Sphaerochaeta sp.]HQB89982.1 sulfite exporter TauE/SafE family protein [Sphaerochaeta sp.]